MTAVLLGAASAALFGAMTVAIRLGLRGGVDAGGAVRAAGRGRPEHWRPRGWLYGALCTVLVAPRDTIAGALHTDTGAPTAGAATLLAGAVVPVFWARRPPTRRELARLAPAGVC